MRRDLHCAECDWWVPLDAPNFESDNVVAIALLTETWPELHKDIASLHIILRHPKLFKETTDHDPEDAAAVMLRKLQGRSLYDWCCRLATDHTIWNKA